jgi:hypothetical protein
VIAATQVPCSLDTGSVRKMMPGTGDGCLATGALASRPRDATECAYLKRTIRRHTGRCGRWSVWYVTSFIGEGPAAMTGGPGPDLVKPWSQSRRRDSLGGLHRRLQERLRPEPPKRMFHARLRRWSPAKSTLWSACARTEPSKRGSARFRARCAGLAPRR